VIAEVLSREESYDTQTNYYAEELPKATAEEKTVISQKEIEM